jgi:SPP1 family predicted phage head-tail adaptor
MGRILKIGDLKKRITLQSKTNVADGLGGFTSTWGDEVSLWAAIWPVSASEQVQAMQTVMTITHRIRIRYWSGIHSSWRIKFGDRYFAIVSIINPNEANKILDLMVKEAAT